MFSVSEYGSVLVSFLVTFLVSFLDAFVVSFLASFLVSLFLCFLRKSQHFSRPNQISGCVPKIGGLGPEFIFVRDGPEP